VPWEKLRRNTSAPASTILRSMSAEFVAGPTVQTILVWRIELNRWGKSVLVSTCYRSIISYG
jgi:hypothetical protein